MDKQLTASWVKMSYELLTDIPSIKDTIYENLNSEYHNLLKKHNLNPLEHRPVFDFDSGNESTKITITIERIDGRPIII